MAQTIQHELQLARRMSRLGTETAFEVLNKARALERQGKDIVHLEIRLADFEVDDVFALPLRSEEHTSELQSRQYLVCRLLLEKKNTNTTNITHHHHRESPLK